MLYRNKQNGAVIELHGELNAPDWEAIPPSGPGAVKPQKGRKEAKDHARTVRNRK